MKKVILGTTALIAVSALTAGTASAAEKIKLNVTGYLQSSFVAVNFDNDAADPLPTDIRSEGEIHFTGKTTLDNGLTFGVNVQLEARATADQVDETFMYVEGAFGRVNFGNEDSAPYLMHYGSPSPVPAWGVNSPNANASGFKTSSTYTNVIGDADKITYFTPRMSGFQLGVSYTPDADEETGTGASPYSVVKNDGAADEAYSIGANYTGKFGSVSVKGSLGYQTITRSGSATTAAESTRVTTFAGGGTITDTIVGGVITNTVSAGITTGATTTVVDTVTKAATSTVRDDTDEYDVGLSVGVSGFTIGAAYKKTDSVSGVKNNDRKDWNLGVTYGQGPWKVGLQYAGIRNDVANVTSDLSAYVLGGQYILGPGITAFGGVQYWDADAALSGSNGNDATVFFLGTALSF